MRAILQSKAALIVLILLASLVVIGLKIKISTDLSLFLPEPESRVERLLHHQLDNGASTKLIFIALSGLPPEQLGAANQQLTDQLSSQPQFSKVINQANDLSQRGLAFVEQNRYLLSHKDLTQQFSQSGLTATLQQTQLDLVSSSGPLIKRFLRQDPTSEVVTLLEDWQGKLSKHKKPETIAGRWFSADQKRTIIVAEINAASTQLESQTEAVKAIRDSYQSIMQPGLTMTLTGPAAFAVESGEDIRADVQLLTWLAIIFVTLFLLLVYRSIGMLLLVFAPLITGVVVATASILLCYGQIHGITLAFGVTLAGVAIDYPIHLLTGLTQKSDIAAGVDSPHVKKIWPTLRLGVISTVIAYAAFLASGFGGLQQLGLFTIIGLITAALFSRWVMPLLMRNKADRRQGLLSLHQALSTIATKANKLYTLVPAALIITLAGLFITESKVIHLNVDSLSPIKESRRAEGKMLREDLGYWYGGHLLIVSGAQKENVLQTSETIEPYLADLLAKDYLTGYDMAAQYIPSKQHQQKQLAALQNTPIEQNLQAALQDSPFKAKTFKKFLAELPELRARQPIDIENFLTQDLGKRLNPLIFDFENQAAGVVLLHSVKNPQMVQQFADMHDDVIYMHLKTAATDLVARSVNRVALIMLGCILLIYLALSYAFKSLMRPLKIMVPTFAAAVATAGILVITGNPLSIFHLISLMLVIGLGLDYALFFNRLPDNADEWDTTFKSLWICAFTTILVFGILTVSQTPPLKAIGATVAIGAFLSIIFAAMWSTRGEKSKLN